VKLTDLVRRASTPEPWSEGDNIPWHEPGFSQRMLREHLSQEHDAASRRFETIDRHVSWIHHELLAERPTRILDLGCGPGLYASRLAGLGHECVGIDYSPASIAYAESRALQENLSCRYVHHDLRTADYGTGYGLAMQIYGELNVFTPADARHILTRAHQALVDGGLLLLEPHTFAAVQALGQEPRSWYSSEGGLFSPDPHLCLQESFWEQTTRTATIRYWIVDAATGQVTRHAQTMQAYDDEQYRSLLEGIGFRQIRRWPSLGGEPDATSAALIAIVAQK
jgi:SAM-dependent methyltransferase